MSNPEPQFAVLVSGSGTLADAMLQAGLPITLMVADRPCVATSEVAPRHGIKPLVLNRREWNWTGASNVASFDRVGFCQGLVHALRHHHIDGVVMAGWETVLSVCFFDGFEEMDVGSPVRIAGYDGRALNSHPALLPAYKGEAYAVPLQIRDGVTRSGTTIHVASADVDGEPYLFQEEVPVEEGDTADTLHERIKVVERRLYTQAVWLWANLLRADPDFRWPTTKQ